MTLLCSSIYIEYVFYILQPTVTDINHNCDTTCKKSILSGKNICQDQMFKQMSIYREECAESRCKDTQTRLV